MGPVRWIVCSCFVVLLPVVICDMDLLYDPFSEIGECEDGFCSIVTLPPPPPIPHFMKSILNDSLDSDGECNLCGLFGVTERTTTHLPRPSDKSSSSASASDGVTSVIVACVMGLCFGGMLLALIWCRKWRHSPSKSSCPFFSDGLFSGQRKSPPAPPSPTESVISPVVNEKSPQSIIMDHGTGGKKSVIQTKYWRRGSDFTIDAHSSVLHPHRPHSDHYGADGGAGSSCTSSPVYAELDGVPIAAHGSNLLMSCPVGSSISPYAVGMNTYSELPDNSMRMVNIASSSSAALLPDSSYDNAAYLPNLNPNDQFASRSLRRLRSGLSGQPLLHSSSGSHHQFNAQIVAPPVTHLTSGTRKKCRQQHQTLAQQLARTSVQRMQEIDQIDDLSSDRTGRAFTGRRPGVPSSSQTFVDGGMHSPSMTTFKSASPYASYSDRTTSRDRDSKRPLPPVPGIRL